MPRAASLAADIADALGVKPELRKGSNGVFDVTADDAVVYSKHREGRYPETAEIIAVLRKLGASKG